MKELRIIIFLVSVKYEKDFRNRGSGFVVNIKRKFRIFDDF